MKLDLAIAAVRDDEQELLDRLALVGERHAADHDVWHVSKTLAILHRRNLAALTGPGERYRVATVPPSDDPHRGVLGALREKGSELVGRQPEPPLRLLRDLRELHVLYTQASIDWTILMQGAQGAQAARDAELVDVVTASQERVGRGMKWTTTRIKTAAPQTLMG